MSDSNKFRLIVLLACLGTFLVPVGLLGAFCGMVWDTLSNYERAEMMSGAQHFASVSSWFSLHIGPSLVAAIAGGVCLLTVQFEIMAPIDPPPALRQAIRTHTIL